MSKNTIKITKGDNFVWKILTTVQAHSIFKSEEMAVYALHEDDTEALVMDEEELNEYIDSGVTLGIEVGFANYKEVKELKERIESHDFHYQRSDDGRVYNAGVLNLKRIHELSKQVPKEDYVRWWNRAAPESHQFINQ